MMSNLKAKKRSNMEEITIASFLNKAGMRSTSDVVYKAVEYLDILADVPDDYTNYNKMIDEEEDDV